MSALQREAIFGIETVIASGLIDKPSRLFTASSQRLIDNVWREFSLRAIPPGDRDALVEIRRSLGDNRHAKGARMREEFEGIKYRYVNSLTPAMAESSTFGSLVQHAYNMAAVNHEPIDVRFWDVIASERVLDHVVTAVKTKRLAAAMMVSPERRIVALRELLSAIRSAGRPFFSPNSVVDVVVERVTLKSTGQRNNTSHTYFAFIRADGTETTFGGYPNKTYDFDGSGNLYCAFEKEPSNTSADVALYLTPPLGQSAESFANRLHKACENFNHNDPPLRYAAGGVIDGFNDNSFVAGFLRVFATPADHKAFQLKFVR